MRAISILLCIKRSVMTSPFAPRLTGALAIPEHDADSGGAPAGACGYVLDVRNNQRIDRIRMRDRSHVTRAGHNFLPCVGKDRWQRVRDQARRRGCVLAANDQDRWTEI